MAAHRGRPSQLGPSASSSNSVAQVFAAPQRGEVARACERIRGMPWNLRVPQDRTAQQNAFEDRAVLIVQGDAAHWENGMAIHSSVVAAILAALTAAVAREAAAACERRQAEAAAQEAAAAREARAPQGAIAKKETEMKVLEQALAQ